MFNFFKKNKSDDEVWYSFFNSLYEYCANRADYFQVNCNQFDYLIGYSYSTFPYYYSHEEEMERFKKLPFQNVYEVLNIIHKKANILPISIDEALNNNLEYPIFNINIGINSDEILHFKTFFVKEDSGKKTYRILYFYAEADTLENVATKITYMPINFSKQTCSKEAELFLQATVALAKYANIEMPKELESRFTNISVVMPVSVMDFERIIELVNLRPYEGNIQEDAKMFYNNYLDEEPENIDEDVSYEEFADSLFSKRFYIVSETNYWESDWKFDPEDAVAFINDLLIDADLPQKIEGSWSFDFPEETYSHTLFPYIQEGLADVGLTLMNIPTFGDNYVFFIVKKDTVNEILELSEKLALGFELV